MLWWLYMVRIYCEKWCNWKIVIDMTKNGGKKNKKMENGKGTSSEGTPPPISDTVNILSQTRQMMDNSPMMLSPNGGQSYYMNTMNMNYPVNL